MKKLLYLFLALLLPALIFVFLKYAGKNEFAIPVYHGKGIENPPSECGLALSGPYLIPDSIFQFFRQGGHVANVLLFNSTVLDMAHFRSKIEDEFGAGAISISDAIEVAGSPVRCDRWKKCVFLMNDPSQAVLFDGEKRIRGYYDLRSREEEDRLRVELKVLLKKY